MYLTLLAPVLVARLVDAQGEGLGYPPPPVVPLSTTKSGVLPVIPTETPFTFVDTLEGAIIEKGPPNPAFTPLNGPAPTQANPAGATYQAVLPPTNYDNGTGSTVTGSVQISSSSSGTGVDVSVSFAGIPDAAVYGPFVYHIHDLPVPANGDCTATLGHLDPQNAGEYYPCIVSAPQNCQVGDLAGKNGAITAGPTFTTAYSDAFLSTVAGNPASVVGKSIVFHTGNTTRITCANFMSMSSGMSNGTVPANASSSSVPYATAVPNEGYRAIGWTIAAVVTMIAAFFM